MKKILFVIVALFAMHHNSFAADSYTVELARAFAKDIFELNGVNYLQPVVEAMNNTANSGFFNGAYVPRKVQKPYFKLNLNGMFGLVPESKKTYAPKLPTSNGPANINELYKYGSYDPVNKTFVITDTAGLIHYAFLVMMYDGTKGKHAGSIKEPSSASTALGSKDTVFSLPPDTLRMLLHDLSVTVPFLGEQKIYYLLPSNLQNTLDSLMGAFPATFDLPAGGKMDVLIAGVPQLEIGSLYGTECLIRFIPKINMGSTIGKFAFWGFGLKHSISQYFYNETEYLNENKDFLNDNPVNTSPNPFDVSVQVVYQGTSLENTVGVTNAELKANASIWDFNIQVGKSWAGIIDVYTAFSYEIININTTYKYLLPVTVQWQLGLLEQGSYVPTEGYPGDDKPQTSEIKLSDNCFKWVLGVTKQIENFGIFLNYSLSNYSIFSGGVQYIF